MSVPISMDAARRADAPATHRFCRMPARGAACGFSLIELMITLSVATILATISLPSFTEIIRTNRLITTADQFEADLLIARREAIKRNTRVLVCPVGTTAGRCGSGTSAWAGGWMVCYDNDFSGDCDDSPSDGTNPNPIRRHGAIDSSLTLTGPASTARFNANGTQGDEGAASLTFGVSGTWTGSSSYVGTITATGNISMVKGHG
jgi:type IV fimbrial biogenesis protein FimT